jgi:hypothetical protein
VAGGKSLDELLRRGGRSPERGDLSEEDGPDALAEQLSKTVDRWIDGDGVDVPPSDASVREVAEVVGDEPVAIALDGRGEDVAVIGIG